MLRRFKRQFHLFTNDIPDDNDYVRWFSIMQHYGCPTRMLDFTYSFFIALFFATEKVSLDTSSHVDCAIWSINHKWLKDKFHKHGKFRLIYLKDKNLKQVGSIKAILNSKSAFIKSLNPLCLNQRLVLQQGLFLLPLDIRKPFMDNLGNIAKEKETRKNVLKIKISIDKKFLNEIYYNLNRMNINNATIFPDIDGFARYLKMVLPIHDKYGGFLAIDKNKF